MPHKEPPSPKKKHSPLPLLLVVFGIIIVVLVILLLSGGEEPDPTPSESAVETQTMDPYQQNVYNTALTELEAGNWVAVEGALGTLDEPLKSALLSVYLTHCADSTVLEDMQSALTARLALGESADSNKTDQVNCELEYLSAYESAHFYDAELQTLVLRYLEALNVQLRSQDEGESEKSSTVHWNYGQGLRCAVITDLYEQYGFLADSPALANAYVDKHAYDLAYGEIYDLTQVLYTEAPQDSDPGFRSYWLTNETAYSFRLTMDYGFSHENQEIHAPDPVTYNFAPGETVEIRYSMPPEGTMWDGWGMSYQITDIYSGSTLLPEN